MPCRIYQWHGVKLCGGAVLPGRRGGLYALCCGLVRCDHRSGCCRLHSAVCSWSVQFGRCVGVYSMPCGHLWGNRWPGVSFVQRRLQPRVRMCCGVHYCHASHLRGGSVLNWECWIVHQLRCRQVRIDARADDVCMHGVLHHWNVLFIWEHFMHQLLRRQVRVHHGPELLYLLRLLSGWAVWVNSRPNNQPMHRPL